ncbi:MAG: HPr family phosphocarrier protein [Candidatus Auribacterota bacterium]|nr:HPr family phosphocarrier protein [Candidatus Auribacterota bacterium]
MISKKIYLREIHGLHARPVAKLVQKCKNFESKITICKGCEKADGCSVLELLMLGATEGVELEIIAVGNDENQAVEEITELFENGSGI